MWKSALNASPAIAPIQGAGDGLRGGRRLRVAGQFEAILSRALDAEQLRIGRRNPRGTIPGGEAEVVHRGGGRYVSVIGPNALFHNPADRGPDVVNLEEIARFSAAFAMVARVLT